MSIEKDKHNGFYVECDLCGEIEEFPDAGNFNEVVHEMKDSGWRVHKDGSEWRHICPVCLEDMETS